MEELTDRIRSELAADELPDADADDLLRACAVLLLTKGPLVTAEDMHNAWAAWAAMREPGHDALVPYVDLPGDVTQPGRPYLDAIRRVADSPISGTFARTLLPYGIPVEDKDRDRLFELYKIVVTSSEALVGRRQAFNTFFITIQGALVAVAGLLLRGSGQVQSKAVALTALAIVGGVIAYSWGSLLRSYGQLNGGKFKVINTLERLFPAAIYTAEWKALGEGRDPAIYRPFTAREAWVPRAFQLIYGLTAILGLLFALGLLKP
jgi:hypothetical protein